MDKKILLIGLLIFIVLISGCVENEDEKLQSLKTEATYLDEICNERCKEDGYLFGTVKSWRTGSYEPTECKCSNNEYYYAKKILDDCTQYRPPDEYYSEYRSCWDCEQTVNIDEIELYKLDINEVCFEEDCYDIQNFYCIGY